MALEHTIPGRPKKDTEMNNYKFLRTFIKQELYQPQKFFRKQRLRDNHLILYHRTDCLQCELRILQTRKTLSWKQLANRNNTRNKQEIQVLYSVKILLLVEAGDLIYTLQIYLHKMQ